MNKILIAVVLAFQLLAGPTELRSQKVRSKSLTPEEIFSAIKSAALETVKSDSASLKKPAFDYNEKEKLLEYYLGGVRVGSFEFESDDPYLLPFEKQIQIELLRDLVKRSVPDEELWRPALNLAEQLVIDTIRDIETTHDKAALQKKLDNRLELFSSVSGFLHQAIQAFAQSKGYTAKRVGPRGLASDTFVVQVIKNPSNGRVQVLPWVKYVKCRDLKKCGDNWPWRELVSENENMIGAYFYQADWGGGRRNEGKIEVRNSTAITFAPRQ